MTVEERKDPVSRDRFPVGLRVLAVDDDPVCLKLLENLLRRCQYNVTMTNQAIAALKLLRENRDKFDLVISDVHMPDMDGFKLLELVGLEMDLPVIMLSAISDTKAVMKGITHGACDYLLKPVRIEELKNIWQHVVRRKKFDSKEHTTCDNGYDSEGSHHISDVGLTIGPSVNNGKLNRKRKDQNEEDDDSDENDHENEDLSTQKRPRVVWSVELHRKFVAAVDQLGIEKAVPKKILDLMNVEKLSRENVASHLQKYKLYLKRISDVASQQANIIAALGGNDTYFPMHPRNGLGNYHALTGSSQVPALTSFQSGGVPGRLTSPNSLGFHGIASNGIIQLGHAHTSTSNSIYDLEKPPRTNIRGIDQGNLLQGIPASLELDQLQQYKLMDEINGHLLGGLSDIRLSTGSSINALFNLTNTNMMLQGSQQQVQSSGLDSQSSVKMMSMSQDPFEINVGTSHFPDLGRCTDNWQGATSITEFSANNLPLSMPSGDKNFSSNNLREAVSLAASQAESNPHDVSSTSTSGAPLLDLLTVDLQCQAVSLGANTLLMPTGTDETSRFSNFGNMQKQEEGSRDRTCKPNLILSSTLNSPLPNNGIMVSNNNDLDHKNWLASRRMGGTMINQSGFSTPFFTQQCVFEKSMSDEQLKSKNGYLLEPSMLQAEFSSNCYNSFDDLMNA